MSRKLFLFNLIMVVEFTLYYVFVRKDFVRVNKKSFCGTKMQYVRENKRCSQAFLGVPNIFKKKKKVYVESVGEKEYIVEIVIRCNKTLIEHC